MIDLTDEQGEELEQHGPIQMRDPRTGRVYVLVPADVYERMRGLLEDDVCGMEAFLAELAPEDWEDKTHYEPKS